MKKIPAIIWIWFIALALSIFFPETAHAGGKKHHKRVVVVANDVVTSDNPLALNSRVSYVVDQDTDEVLYARNETLVAPIASITKLMTALVVVEANQPMDEVLTITQDEVDTVKHTGSRLAVGTQMTRKQLLELALMSSENRAAHTLCRSFPGGLAKCVEAMNAKAQALGMKDTVYEEPTGLSFHNHSTAKDLAILVKAAYQHDELRDYTTTPEREVVVNGKTLKFNNTNSLVRKSEWHIGLQKTGFINEAGRCLVMQAELMGRKVIMVFLKANRPGARQVDAEKIKRFIEKPV